MPSIWEWAAQFVDSPEGDAAPLAVAKVVWFADLYHGWFASSWSGGAPPLGLATDAQTQQLISAAIRALAQLPPETLVDPDPSQPKTAGSWLDHLR